MINILDQGILLGELCRLLKDIPINKNAYLQEELAMTGGDSYEYSQWKNELVEVCRQIKCTDPGNEQFIDDFPLQEIAYNLGIKTSLELKTSIFLEAILNKYGRSLNE